MLSCETEYSPLCLNETASGNIYMYTIQTVPTLCPPFKLTFNFNNVLYVNLCTYPPNSILYRII